VGAIRTPATTAPPEQAYQLEHATAEIIRARAVEVFGKEDLAADWLRTSLSILDGCTPEEYALSQDIGKRREVLIILGRIDYGMFS
jgi:uncharacterized protein (DUF2384 family)